jgi:hypothetical protein
MAKRFKRRLDTPTKLVKIEGLGNIPLNPDGTVVYGTYTIYYVWDYDGIRVRKPRVLEFNPPDNRIEFRNNGVIINKVEKIAIISSQSTSPYTATFFSSINTSLPSGITAHYVERDINDVITLDVDITNDVTINTALVESSVVSNKLPQGTYVFYYEVEYNNGSTTYTKSLSREIISATYTTVPQENPPLYTLEWENLPLPVINKDVGDAFPSLAEMTDIIPTAVITETATGNVTRFATTYLTPTEPAGGVTTSSTYLIKFIAINLLSGSGADTGFDDVTFNTYVVPQIKTRSIQYNIATQNPQPLPIEITFSPSASADITFIDTASGSNPVPSYYYNNGNFPSEAQLSNGVTATYIDADGITQNLAVTFTRPTGSLYTGRIKEHFFNNNEVIMSIPRTWPVTYSATAPDGTIKTATRNIIIEDTIAPVFSPVVPTTMEKGTGYNTWLDRAFYGYDYPRFDYNYPAPRSGTTITVDKTQQEFNALDDGDTFTTTYTTIDNSGNATITVQVTTCQDTVSPTLEFNSTLTFPTGSNPTDEELKVGVATSDLSEPITLTVDDSGINYSVQGFYTASYTATDAFGNSRTRTRNVFVKGAGPTLTPPGPSPIACPTTPGVPNIFLDGTEIIANITDDEWTEGLYASLQGENITYKIVISQNSIDALPTTAAGTLDWDNNSDGWIDVEVTPLYINYEIQDENGVPLICTTRYIETIDVLPPTIYNIPNPILVYKVPNDGFGQSSTTPNDVITDIVSKINVIDNVDGTGFTTATLEGITQVDINNGSDIVRTLRFTDSEGNESRYVATIQFTDNVHPVITLLGDDPLILTSSVLPSDPGATATDFEDGSLAVTSSWGSVFPNGKAIYGTWNVKYTATDSTGVIVEEIREVQVPYFPPTITLLGDDPYTFNQNPGSQQDPYAEAYSVLDGDLSSQIDSDWDDYINGSTPEGTYTINYSVTDSRGNTATTTRQVTYIQLSGYLEEVPFLYPTSGSVYNFTELDSDSAIPIGVSTNNSLNPRVEISASYLPTTTKDYTISFWLKNSAVWASDIIDSNGALPNSGSLYMAQQATNRALIYRPGTADVQYTNNNYLNDISGKWIHVIMTANSSGDLNLYRNGILIETRSFTPAYDLDLSNTFVMSSPFQNKLDSVDFINAVMEADDVLSLYNAGQGNRFLSYYFENPIITLLGDDPYIFTENPGSQLDPGATASDFKDGDLTSQITSDWNTYINGSTLEGTYAITYSVTDSDGNTTTATRTVSYNSCPYTTLPNLYFDGSSTAAINSINNIALGGATLNTSDGKYGSDSFNFGASGNKQPILIGTDIDLSTGIYTFSMWFYNKRGGSDWASVLRQTSGGSPAGTANYPILIRDTDNYLGMMKREGGSNNFYSTGYDMSSFEGDTSWNHLAVVADGTNSTFYVNGIQAGSVIAKVVTTSVGELNSYDGNDTQTFAEGIDEFAYWDVALEACEINKIYNSSVSLKRSHLVQYEESRFITLYDDASLNNGILELDGTGDYAIYDGDFRFTDQISVSAWFKTSDSGDQRIVSCHVRDAGNNGFFIRLEDGSLQVRHPDGGGAEITVAGSWNDGNWHHVVITWIASTTAGKKIYVDGIEEYSANSGGADGYNSSYDLHVGANPWSGNAPYANFQGQIDDLRVVRKIMDSTEVTDLYNSTSGSH